MSTGKTAAPAPLLGAGNTSSNPRYTAPPVIVTDDEEELFTLTMAFAPVPPVDAAKIVPPEIRTAPAPMPAPVSSPVAVITPP